MQKNNRICCHFWHAIVYWRLFRCDDVASFCATLLINVSLCHLRSIQKLDDVISDEPAMKCGQQAKTKANQLGDLTDGLIVIQSRGCRTIYRMAQCFNMLLRCNFSWSVNVTPWRWPVRVFEHRRPRTVSTGIYSNVLERHSFSTCWWMWYLSCHSF